MTLLLFASATGTLTAPDVTILSASNIKAFSATLNGRIDNNHGSDITAIGFEWGTETGAYPFAWEETSASPYIAGAYSHNIDGLTELDTYYYRFYATNATGTTYSPEFTFSTISSTHAISIGGLDRTTDVLANSLQIEDIINDQQNTCSLSIIDRSGNGIPETDDEIVITDLDGNKAFGGYITNITMTKLSNGVIVAQCSCIDYSRLLDGVLVKDNYQDKLDSTIIKTIIDDYANGSGITYTNVEDGATIDKITFNYIQPSQAFRRIAELASRYWYIDYDKDIHYFPLATTPAPFDIDSANTEYFDLQIGKDATQIKNRIYVRGGTKLSDPTTYSEIGDGVKVKFVLPDKPHDITLTVNSVEKTVGIKNVHTSGYDWYLNFQEKYIEQDSGGTVLESTDTLEITYTYDIPILIALENTQSIIDNGVKEFAIFDNTISTTQEARDRASAELTDYATNMISGSFKTYTTGFRSGQYININLSDYDINDNYIVQKVSARSEGAGKYEYTVSVASAKTVGIIRFLIDLLESNKNLIELDDDEVVDELFNVTDSLLSDSLLDELTIDSQGDKFTWCTDSLQSSPQTRIVWDLFSWG